MRFKNINILSESTRQKPTSWSQIIERAKNASLLFDAKFVPSTITDRVSTSWVFNSLSLSNLFNCDNYLVSIS